MTALLPKYNYDIYINSKDQTELKDQIPVKNYRTRESVY